MRRDVTTLVISVDCQVQAHQLNKVLVVGETELVGQVVTVILAGLGWRDFAIFVDVAVDAGGNVGQLSNEVHGVLKCVLPVLCLLQRALGVCLCESGFTLEGGDGDGELGHWVEIIGAAVDELFDELRKLGTGSPLCGEVADLLFRWNLAGQEQPEETFRERLSTAGGLG
jgi:hypothetical protein